MKRGWDIPIELNVPVEAEQKANERVNKDILYLHQRQKKLHKQYNNPRGTSLRRIAEYLWQHHQGILSYIQISIGLNIPEGTIKLKIGELNFYEGFPMTWIPVPKKAGFIQGSLNNYTDYENWDVKKQRTVSTMEQVKEKAERISNSKRKQMTKIKVKNEMS